MYEKRYTSAGGRTAQANERAPIPEPVEETGEALKKFFAKHAIADISRRGILDFTDKKCTEVDPEMFFPDRNTNIEIQAKKICNDCADKLGCAALALVNDEPFSVMGGLSANDRKTIARKIPELRRIKRLRAKENLQD